MWRGSKLPRQTSTPSGFYCNPSDYGRKIRKEAISSPGGKLPSEEIAANPAYTPPGSIKAREGLWALSRSPGEERRRGRKAAINPAPAAQRPAPAATSPSRSGGVSRGKGESKEGLGGNRNPPGPPWPPEAATRLLPQPKSTQERAAKPQGNGRMQINTPPLPQRQSAA